MTLCALYIFHFAPVVGLHVRNIFMYYNVDAEVVLY